MKLQHISKTGFTIPGVGETDEHGIIEVPDDVAGHPGDPRRDEILDALNVEPRVEHNEALRLKAEYDRLDQGSGLLAQDTWKPYGKAAKEAVKQEEGDR